MPSPADGCRPPSVRPQPRLALKGLWAGAGDAPSPGTAPPSGRAPCELHRDSRPVLPVVPVQGCGRDAAGRPGPAWVRLVTRTAGISRARAPAPLPPPRRRTLNPGPPHPGPDPAVQSTMELLPGLLLLLLAALLPLAARSGPTARPAGREGPGECARARPGNRDAAAATRCSPLPCVVPGAGWAWGCGR